MLDTDLFFNFVSKSSTCHSKPMYMRTWWDPHCRRCSAYLHTAQNVRNF